MSLFSEKNMSKFEIFDEDSDKWWYIRCRVELKLGGTISYATIHYGTSY